MARSKAEVREFLSSVVGKQISPADGDLNGQCVSLVKSLMAFVGAPNPRAARGHAKTAGDQYLREGLGKAGKGWLTVCINRTMAGEFGHIWLDLAGEANYEQNGAVPLKVTKNTRPLSQAHQLISFDQWVTAAPAATVAAPMPTPAVQEAVVKQRTIWDSVRKVQHNVYLVPTGNDKASLMIRSTPRGVEQQPPKTIGSDLQDSAGLDVAFQGDMNEALVVVCRNYNARPMSVREFWTTDLKTWYSRHV